MHHVKARAPHPGRVFVVAAKVGKFGLRNFPAVAATIAATALTSCGMPGAPQPPSLKLPVPVSNLSAVRTGDQVALAWTMPTKTTDKVTLKDPIAARVCRGQTSAASCNIAATVEFAPGGDGKSNDALPPALATGSPRPLTYYVELVNHNGRSAGLSNGVVILAGQAPSAIDGLTAELHENGVLLHWTPAPPGAPSTAVRLVRTLLTPPTQKPSPGPASAPPEPVVLDLLVESNVSSRALDNGTRFGENYEYRAQRLARITEDGQTLELAGPLSAPVRVDVADIFPPAVPSGLVAVATAGENGNPPAIDLSWQPDTDPGLAGYIVYRRETTGGESFAWQSISPAEPLIGPGFHDSNVQVGHSYMYAVSAIGQNGRESARSPEAGDTVPGP